MLTRLYRQRRRIFLLAAGSALAAGIATGWTAAPMAAAWGATAAAVVVAAGPRYRGSIEAMAIALPVAAFVALPFPGLLAVAVLLALALRPILRGSWSDRLPWRPGLSSRRRVRLPGRPADLWPRLVPGQGHPEDHWTGTLIDFHADPRDPAVLHLRFGRDRRHVEEVRVTTLHLAPPMRVRLRVERADGGLRENVTLDMRLTEVAAGRTRLDCRLRHDPAVPRLVLARWLDDAFGDEGDSLCATLSDRHDWSLHGLGRALRPEPDPRVVW